MPNLGDIGGYRTSDGKLVRRGLAYRSDQLNPISAEDLVKVSELDLKNDLDLQTDEEAKARPDQLPPGVKRVPLNVLADAQRSYPAFLQKLLGNPKKANAAFGGGKVEAIFERGYREFISLPSAKRAYRELFVALGEGGQLPSLFHCTAGKDRTGWAAAAFLTLLGVPKDKVIEDYLRGNEYILPRYKKAIDAFVAAGGEQAIPLAIAGAKPEYLNASFSEMERPYGSIENYFCEGLGIDAAGQEALRALYLVTK